MIDKNGESEASDEAADMSRVVDARPGKADIERERDREDDTHKTDARDRTAVSDQDIDHCSEHSQYGSGSTG